jgi:hypothetical protein
VGGVVDRLQEALPTVFDREGLRVLASLVVGRLGIKGAGRLRAKGIIGVVDRRGPVSSSLAPVTFAEQGVYAEPL